MFPSTFVSELLDPSFHTQGKLSLRACRVSGCLRAPWPCVGSWLLRRCRLSAASGSCTTLLSAADIRARLARLQTSRGARSSGAPLGEQRQRLPCARRTAVRIQDAPFFRTAPSGSRAPTVPRATLALLRSRLPALAIWTKPPMLPCAGVLATHRGPARPNVWVAPTPLPMPTGWRGDYARVYLWLPRSLVASWQAARRKAASKTGPLPKYPLLRGQRLAHVLPRGNGDGARAEQSGRCGRRGGLDGLCIIIIIIIDDYFTV